MEKILSALQAIPEYRLLLETLSRGQAAAVTGVGQINRSHMIAAVYRQCARPVVVICQDDMAARRLQEELKAFLGETVPSLPSRELTLYDTAVVSRSWEQRRLRQLYDLAQGATRLQIFTWEALSQRTVPKSVLLKAAFQLETGKDYSLEDITARLAHSGYTRCDMVEGPGQFALRGGILDVFSPAADRPFRGEFWGDTLDTMGFFDPDTQRRTENVEKVTILPVGETQPMLHPGGLDGLCRDISGLITRQKRRRTPNEALLSTLERDLEKYRNQVMNPASDRYMALIYPENATAMDYIPQDAVILVLDQSGLHRAARTRVEEMGLQLDSLLQSGLVAGELCDYVCQWEDFCRCLTGRKVAYLDAFGGGTYPEECRPAQLLPITAKQLPGYGGNLETAAEDLSHYQKMEFACLVLCGTRRRAELLQQMLTEKTSARFCAFPCTPCPSPVRSCWRRGRCPSAWNIPARGWRYSPRASFFPRQSRSARQRKPPPTGKS